MLFTGCRLCRRAPTLDFLMFGCMIFMNPHWFSSILIDFHLFSLIFIDLRWFALIFIDLHGFPLISIDFLGFHVFGWQKVWQRMAADYRRLDGSRTPIIPLLDDSMMACWRIPWIDDVMSGWWSDECGWRMVWIVNGEWWIDDWND